MFLFRVLFYIMCRAVKNRSDNPSQPNKKKLTLQQPILILTRPPNNNRSIRPLTNKINKINLTISHDELNKPKQKHPILRCPRLTLIINRSKNILHHNSNPTNDRYNSHVPKTSFLYIIRCYFYGMFICVELF